ncbi:hypothetical protein L7F22_052654 [Adiantum nelumboides]|nr:hypothetical protein [Adiantum nelumboides]
MHPLELVSHYQHNVFVKMTISVGLLKTLAFAFVGQLIPASVFIPLQTEKYYDLCGSLGFLSTTLFSLYRSPFRPTLSNQSGSDAASTAFGFIRSKLSNLLINISSANNAHDVYQTVDSSNLWLQRHPRQWIASACVIFWGARLGSFLFQRIHKQGRDARFDKIKTNPITFSFAWFMQAVWISLTALPVYMINALPATLQPDLSARDVIALTIWSSGLLFEIVADRQKSQWRKAKEEKKHEEQFISTGVWSWSRHPNYFGEITLWTGLASLASFTFSHQPVRTYFGDTYANLAILAPILSPLFEYALIRYLSGVPILERNMDKKMKGDKKYAKYKANVPCFVPFIGSKD